ncbi:MAG: sulfotransferase family 2 domain-containing protein [Reichenbachiella sp.]|uniref:sulfotransferase family 2 domain-containing protein n=1 Tax=Reichenbachiella sp. TaxID=2184521 RepID=UPI003263B004
MTNIDNVRHWLNFLYLILKKGNLFRITFDNEAYKRQIHQYHISDNQFANVEVNLSRWKKFLLKFPVIGQIVSLTSLYRDQRRWPIFVYHWPEKKLAFVRISKNASTTILASIMKAQFPHLDITTWSVDEINLLAQASMKPYIEEGYNSFTVVRHPIDRLKSCYFDQVLDRAELSYFSRLYFGIFPKDISFYQFVKRVMNIPDELKEIHFRKQVKCIPQDIELRIFKYEEFDEELTAFLESYEVIVKNMTLNKRTRTPTIINHGEIKSLIMEGYKEDFIKFGYN